MGISFGISDETGGNVVVNSEPMLTHVPIAGPHNLVAAQAHTFVYLLGQIDTL
jgi:hypothetical protein